MINIICVGIGAVLFIVSLANFWKTYNLPLSRAYRLWWALIALFILFFLFGYLYYAADLLLGKSFLGLDYVVSQIFLWGSVFTVLISFFFLRLMRGEVEYVNKAQSKYDEIDRKMAEIELIEIKQLYRELFENVNIGILRSTPGPEGTFIDMNPAMIKMFEADSREQLMAMHPSDIYWDAGQRKIVSDSIMAKGFANEEIKFKTLKGRAIWGHITSVKTKDESGKVYFNSTIEDVTEQKRVKEQLLALKNKYDAILMAVPDIIMEVDNKKLYTWANEAGYEFFGKDVIGREAAYYFVGEQEIYKQVIPVFKGCENVVYVESWQRRRDGEKRLLAWWCKPLKDEKGNVKGALSSARDITEYKKIEEKENEYLKRLSYLSKYANDYIILLDDKFKFLETNERVQEAYGYTRDELIVMHATDLRAPETKRLFDMQIGEVVSTGKGLYETVHQRKDGTTFPVEINLRAIDLEGKRLYQAIIRDISDRKKTELAKEIALETANKYIEIKTIDEIYAYVGMKILTVSGAKYAMLTSRHPEQETLRLRLVPGVEPYLQASIKLIGFDPFKVSYPLRDMPGYVDGSFQSRKLLRTKEGLYELVAGKIPKTVCQGIEKLLGVSSVYTVGFSWGRELYGAITLGYVSGKGPQDTILVESLANETALALRRVYAEESSKASELRYRRLFESAKDGILILDYETGEIVDVNPYLSELLDYPGKEMLGKHLWDIGVFKDIAASKDAYKELQSKDYIHYEDLPLEIKTGKQIEVEFVSNVYMVNDKKVIQCNIRNISERKRAEKTLKQRLLDLEIFNKAAMNREDKILELKKKVEELEKGAGRSP